MTSTILFVLLLACLAGIGISAVKQSGPDTGKNHALIIGINDYDRWPKLKSPVKDAEAIAKVLTQKYNFSKSNIILLTDKTKDKPTLANIINHLDNFAVKLTDKDNLLVFFSGHSIEDEDGETYWIPKNGKKKSKLTWLKHSAITEEYFTSEEFKAKNLCIVTDSAFIGKLLRSRPISLTPFDLRYPEKITEKATRRSREVISFGDVHWPGDAKTQGLGLFAYYFHKALSENTLDVIDIENLIFDENIMFAISKVAGTKLEQGRFRSPMDKGGQFIIKKMGPVPIVNVVKTAISPQKGYPGEDFIVKATTSGPASEVQIELLGKIYKMNGNGTDWEFKTSVDKIGSTPFMLAAINEKDVAGKPAKGELVTIKRRAEIANVQAAGVEPESGLQGASYNFKVTTDKPAKSVELVINDKRYKMKGAGTGWSLSQKIDAIGTVNFSAVATNEDGVQGKAESGNLQLAAAPVKILSAKASPETGFAGEEFTINVQTDLAASSVSIELDGETFPMEGSDKKWRFKKSIPDIGSKQFTVIAKNVEGKASRPAKGQLLTKKSPVPIPDVASVDVKLIGPGKGYPGDSYEFTVATTASSQSVAVMIDGTPFPMQGSGTSWRYVAKIDKLGTSRYQVSAKNKDGAQGQSREGDITTVKKPLELVKVLKSEISPAKGYAGKDFTFSANTDRPARGVTLIVGKNTYEMTGSGTDWRFKRRIDQIGDFNVSIIARNADDVDGPITTAALKVEKEIKGFEDNKDGTVTNRKTGKVSPRFIDNGDGTVTDLVSSLMWLKEPKTIPVSYEKAVEYCRSLDFKGYSGWRLPTIAEWRKMVDRKQKNPALPPKHPFGNVMTHVGYWSKSKHKFGPKYVYQMNLWYGKPGHSKKEEDLAVWPVRYVELSEKG